MTYAEFVVKDNAILFENVCEERKAQYRSAAVLMALNGCFDDAAFLMALIGEPESTPWMVNLSEAG